MNQNSPCYDEKCCTEPCLFYQKYLLDDIKKCITSAH